MPSSRTKSFILLSFVAFATGCETPTGSSPSGNLILVPSPAVPTVGSPSPAQSPTPFLSPSPSPANLTVSITYSNSNLTIYEGDNVNITPVLLGFSGSPSCSMTNGPFFLTIDTNTCAISGAVPPSMTVPLDGVTYEVSVFSPLTAVSGPILLTVLLLPETIVYSQNLVIYPGQQVNIVPALHLGGTAPGCAFGGFSTPSSFTQYLQIDPNTCVITGQLPNLFQGNLPANIPSEGVQESIIVLSSIGPILPNITLGAPVQYAQTNFVVQPGAQVSIVPILYGYGSSSPSCSFSGPNPFGLVINPMNCGIEGTIPTAMPSMTFQYQIEGYGLIQIPLTITVGSN